MERQPAVRPAKKGESVKEFIGRWERMWEKPMLELLGGEYRQEVGLVLDDNGEVLTTIQFDETRGYNNAFHFYPPANCFHGGFYPSDLAFCDPMLRLKRHVGYSSLDEALGRVRKALADDLQERERVLSEYVSPDPVVLIEVVESKAPEEEKSEEVLGFIARVRASIPSLW